jgi:hypothetical protein
MSAEHQTPTFPSLSEFREWLEQMPGNAVVTRGWSCHSCPLARWLKEIGVGPEPYVRPDLITEASAWRPSADPADLASLPKWANIFATRIDQVGLNRARRNNGFGPVTADDCRQILSGLTE